MPCRSDYMEPTKREIESVNVAKRLVYISKCLGIPVPTEIAKAAEDCYGNVNKLDEHTDILCSLLTSLTLAQQNLYLYDGRNAEARQLAEWWDAHQKADRLREEKAHKHLRTKTLREQALSKLTPEEIEALEL